MAEFNFNRNAVPAREAFSLIPAGWYNAFITESVIENNRAGNGRILKLSFSVMTEGYVGRKLTARLNVVNASQKAELIAKQDLGDIIDACGLTDMLDTVQLHNKPMRIKVKVRPAEGQYEESNEVTRFGALEGAAAPAAQQAAFQLPTSAPAAGAGFSPPAASAVAAPAFTPPPAATGAPPWATRAA